MKKIILIKDGICLLFALVGLIFLIMKILTFREELCAVVAMVAFLPPLLNSFFKYLKSKNRVSLGVCLLYLGSIACMAITFCDEGFWLGVGCFVTVFSWSIGICLLICE